MPSTSTTAGGDTGHGLYPTLLFSGGNSKSVINMIWSAWKRSQRRSPQCAVLLEEDIWTKLKTCQVGSLRHVAYFRIWRIGRNIHFYLIGRSPVSTLSWWTFSSKSWQHEWFHFANLCNLPFPPTTSTIKKVMTKEEVIPKMAFLENRLNFLCTTTCGNIGQRFG